MKYSNKFLLMVLSAALFANCSGPKSYEQDNLAVNESSYDVEETIDANGNDEKVEKAALDEQFVRLNRALGNAVTIVEAKTKYNSNFEPTIHLQVKNSSNESVTAFGVGASELPDFEKRIKANLGPGETFKTSFKIDGYDVSGDLSIKINRIIYSDGQMIEVSNL